jgi:hypothetical protein
MLYSSAPFVHLPLGIVPFLLAQEPYAEAGELSAGQIVLILIVYLIAAFFCQKIFEKCGVPNPWFAWIPILGTYATFQAGDEENPTLWTILSLIPCINIVAAIKQIMAWIKICQKLGKSPWLLLVAFIPFGAIFLLGYLAFG